MGWTWYHATHYKRGKIDRKAECDAFFTEGLSAGWYKIEKSALVGSTYYAAIRKLRRYKTEKPRLGDETELIPESEQFVFAVVFLTSTNAKDYYSFGYKDMDESMGPGSDDCPIGILDLLSPTDNEFANAWRDRCRAKAEKKKAIKSDPNSLDNLPIGTVIQCGDTELYKSAPIAQYKRPFWMVVGERLYFKKKTILYKGYKVISKPETVS